MSHIIRVALQDAQQGGISPERLRSQSQPGDRSLWQIMQPRHLADAPGDLVWQLCGIVRQRNSPRTDGPGDFNDVLIIRRKLQVIQRGGDALHC